MNEQLFSPVGADSGRRSSLCEVLDRVLHKGVVATGEVTLSLAGVDLIYLNLNVLLMSAGRIAEVYDQPSGE
jgi:gas vesicle structural protein